MSRIFKSDKEIEFYIGFRSRVLPLLCLATFVGVSVAVFWCLWDVKLFTPMAAHFAYLKNVIAGDANLASYFEILQTKKLLFAMEWRAGLSVAFGLAVAVLLALPWRKSPKDLIGLEVIEGSEVFDDVRSGLPALKRKMKAWKKKGIQIYRGKGGRLQIPYACEPLHILYAGGIGSGKSVSMQHAIQSILDRQDRAIIYDMKGDMTEWMGGMDGVSMISITDKRSEPWHIARDINNAMLARELAQTAIQETSDPTWSNNARDVLAGCIEYLIATKPNTWGFKDISEMLNGERQDLVKKLKSIKHGSVNTIDKPNDDKSASGVFSTLRSGVWIFDILAKAWGNPSSGFSIKAWLKDEYSENRIVIVRNNPEISNVSNWLIYLIFNQLFGEVLSLPDSKERRMWMILDEWASLPKFPSSLEACLVASRSKGFRFLAAIQTFSSMRAKYGADVAQTLYAQFATKIICRTNDAETASKLADDLGGQRKVRRAEIKQVSTIDAAGENVKKWQIDWMESVEPCMLNSAIMGLPDPTEVKRVYAWFYSSGFPLARLQWDFLDIEKTAERDAPVKWLDEVITLEKEGIAGRDDLDALLKSDDFVNLDDIDDEDFLELEDEPEDNS